MALTNWTNLGTSLTNWLARSDLTTYYSDFITILEAELSQTMRTRQMETTTTLTPGAGGSVALPSDFQEARNVTWLGSPYRQLDYCIPSFFARQYPDNPSGNPSYYTIIGTTLYVMPLSTTNLTLDYWQKIPGLETNTTNWLMTLTPSVYLFGGLREAYAFIKDVQSASAYDTRLQDILDKIKMAQDKDQGPTQIQNAIPVGSGKM